MIRDFHAHIYFDADEVGKARALGDEAHRRRLRIAAPSSDGRLSFTWLAS